MPAKFDDPRVMSEADRENAITAWHTALARLELASEIRRPLDKANPTTHRRRASRK